MRNTAQQFWDRWTELYAPSLIKQNKWINPKKSIEVGNVVLVADRSLKGDYKLARVVEVFPGIDGNVRKVRLCYNNFRPGEPLSSYAGAPDTKIIRAVQRLALIVAEDELNHDSIK